MHDRKRAACFFSAAIIALLTMTACAGAPVPNEKLSQAEQAIATAQQDNASVNAPLDLRMAQDKLGMARNAVSQEENVTAGRFADEATVDAQVADARTRTARAEALSREMQDSIQALRAEIGRTPG